MGLIGKGGWYGTEAFVKNPESPRWSILRVGVVE